LAQCEKNDNKLPDCGTIDMRLASSEYKDPKGRSVVAYGKVMQKLKLTKEKVIEEAGKLNIELNEAHFEVPEVKKGRAKKEKDSESTDSSKKRGRPKKALLEIVVDDKPDLFASLVQESVEVSDISDSDSSKKMSDEEKALKKAKKEQERKQRDEKKQKEEEEKAAKKAQLEKEREEKKQKEEEEKAAKIAKKEQERKEKEDKKKQEEEEKAAKIAKKEQERKEKEEKKKQEEEEKSAKKALKEKKTEGKEETKKTEEKNEKVKVKTITIDGTSYYLTNDNTLYNMEKEPVGVYNKSKNTIEEFSDDEEESEDEYDE
jgi:hypothetical protein